MSNIMALDVGTTSVRCFVLNAECTILGKAAEKVELLSPQPGYFEIEPEELWSKIICVLETAVKDAKLLPSDISSFGICTQRGTFVTWNHRTNEYYHNFITWKDMRADAINKAWNSSFTFKAFHKATYALYKLTGKERYRAASLMKLWNGQVTGRLLYELKYNERLKTAIRNKCVRLELLDSWILYKLRSGNGLMPNVEHVSDITSCSATGLFDPFILRWSTLLKFFYNLDICSILPKVINNNYNNLGYIHPLCFGSEDWRNTRIPITASMSDQSAAILGCQIFNSNDIKITMGTGGFINIITGNVCHACTNALYPLVAWQFGQQPIYCIEAAANDIGSIMNWGQQCGLFNNPSETSAIADSITDCGGVYFIPAFSGLATPLNKSKVATGFIGITTKTKRAHLIRALLESIVYCLLTWLSTIENENKYHYDIIRVDGGVSMNDFVCQLLADGSCKTVERSTCSQGSIRGITYAAGLNQGLWQDFNALEKLRSVDRLFQPNPVRSQHVNYHLQNWLKALEHFSNWY